MFNDVAGYISSTRFVAIADRLALPQHGINAVAERQQQIGFDDTISQGISKVAIVTSAPHYVDAPVWTRGYAVEKP